MKYIFKTVILTALFFMSSCDLDLLDDPNRGKIETANVGMLLNSVQIQTNNLINNLSSISRGYTRMEYQFGDYISAPTTFDTAWSIYYADILPDIDILIKQAESEDKMFLKQAGIAKILKVYTTITMVDFFGDIPYSEATQGSDNVNPVADTDISIYDKMYDLLDEAIADIENPDANDTDFEDIYFGTSSHPWDRWVSLAKTLKFKMYLQTRKFNEGASRTGINALINENQLLDHITNAEPTDFEFRYGTSLFNPRTKSPIFTSNYYGNVNGYMSNSYMNELKSKSDPRLLYYFYRQSNESPTGANLVCDANDSDPNVLCYIGNKYWGRDHAITAGIPPDSGDRTVWGLYPAGGRFDASNPNMALPEDTAEGAGINPLILMSYVNFMKAEAALTISGIVGDPRGYFELGIRQSIEKVMSFGDKPGVLLPDAVKPTPADIDLFVTRRLNEYDNASDTDAKLQLIMRQYWVALWGNGVESYNNYRRTGYPNLQHPLSSGTVFPRVCLYPSVYTTYNSNAVEQPITNQVFWDTNEAGFID